MGLLDSILGAAGQGNAAGGTNQLVGVLGGLLAQNGGLQGLADKFAQAGHGQAFSSWVGMGANQLISSDQIQKVLGSGQVGALATKLGVDPSQASQFLADYLPKVVDKLTPAGKVDQAVNHQQALASILPSLLQSLAGKTGGASAQA